MVHQIEIVYDDGSTKDIDGDYALESGVIKIDTYGKYGVDTIIIPHRSFNHMNVVNDKNIDIII